MSNKKKKAPVSRDMEVESAKMLGKHASREKRRVLLVMTLLACATPLLLSARLWADIPAVVPSGIIGSDGKDDSLPRWVVAFGLPALMCVLDAIAHAMLQFNQKRMTIPPLLHRLVGRWGFPILSVLFCSGMILESTGAALSLPFITPCVLGLTLMLLGSHMWDCPRDARVALRFSFTENEAAWKAVHRFAAWVWLVAGLVVLVGVMLTASSTVMTAVLIVAALLAPIAYGVTWNNKL
ncbi:MAG: SdpI family protein [Oscillibacter sp.]